MTHRFLKRTVSDFFQVTKKKESFCRLRGWHSSRAGDKAARHRGQFHEIYWHDLGHVGSNHSYLCIFFFFKSPCTRF